MSGDVPTQLRGALLLDYTTVATAPKFFSLLALVLRASGMQIVVMGKPEEDKKAAQDGIGFNSFHIIPVFASERRLAKLNWALQLLKTGPVIWPDIDFGTWGKELPRVDNIPGLVILNWASVAATGGKGSPTGAQA